ncbi:MAG: hypothetical protein JW985_03700 [Alphaproteobacteria bacterium]|nr:hypothetical protein [Alphaproteobacteria bacterium]
MAKKIKFFYQKIFTLIFGFVILPVLKIFGIGPDAFADTVCLASQCTVGDTRYTSCGTSLLQKQVCQACTYTEQVCMDANGNTLNNCSNWGWATINGTKWVDTGDCIVYSNECTLGQTSTRSCTTEVGTGTQTRSCTTLVVGTYTYYMWGEYGTCVYTSCAVSTDVLDSGKCYCRAACPMPNGYGTMIAQVRYSSVCPVAASSSSSAVQ